MDENIGEKINNEFHSPSTTKSILQNSQKRFNYKLFNNNDSPFRILPCASTPPRNTFVIKNPFEKKLKDELHTHFMSPTVFVKYNTPKSEDKFRWTIEDISTLKPADIDESSVEQVYSIETEHFKDNLIHDQYETFFGKNKVLPSPYHHKKPEEQINSPKTVVQKKDCETQTMLSLPMVLPKKLEKLLEPYFNNPCESEKNLYTKLFECDHDDDNDSFTSTPVESPFMSPVAGSPIISQCKNQSVLSLNSLDISFDNIDSPSRISNNDSCAKISNCDLPQISDINESTNETYSDLSLNKRDVDMNIENVCSPDSKDNFIKIDMSNSNTPRSKLFSSQRKKLSDSFLMEYEDDDNKENECYSRVITTTNDDVGYFSTITMDESNWNAATVRLRASTPTDI